VAGAGRVRPVVVALLATLFVIGLVVADVVTLSKAKPSFSNETRDFHALIESTSTTTVPRRTPPSSTQPGSPAPARSPSSPSAPRPSVTTPAS
jgi:hypothetical protein